MTGRAPLGLTLAALVEAAIARLIAFPSSTLMLAIIQAADESRVSADDLAAFLPEGQGDLMGADAVEALEALRTAAPWGQTSAQAHDQHRGWRAVEGNVADALALLEQAWAHCPDADLRTSLETHVSGLQRLRLSAQRRERQASDQADALATHGETLAILADLDRRLDSAGRRLDALEAR